VGANLVAALVTLVVDGMVRSNGMTEQIQLIRQWWYAYRQVLEHPSTHGRWAQELDKLTLEGEKAGIIIPGRKMPKDGAEDLADEVDEFKRLRKMYPYDKK
jgi:hypothetical protein